MDLEALRSAVETDPTDVRAFEQLQNALIEQRSLPDLLAVYKQIFEAVEEGPARDRLLHVVDKAARTADDAGISAWLNFQLGHMFWKDFDNADRAEFFFRRIREGAEIGGAVAEFYTDFYARRDNWRKLEQLYEEGGLDPITARRRLADIAEERGKKDKAIGFLQAVFDAEGADDAFQRLEVLYGDVAKWHSLIELYKSRLKALPEDDAQGQIDLHLKMIDIYRDQISSDTKIIATWQAILQLDPANEMAMDALQDLYERMQRWPDLVRVLQSRIDCSPSPDDKLRLHERIASIMLERFSNASEAIKQYQAILEIDEGNLDALRALKDLYATRKAWDQYVEVARREIDLTAASDQERGAQLVELARLAGSQIRHPAVATELWEAVRREDPENAEALGELEPLYERSKEYDKLVDVLEARIRLEPSPEGQVDLLEKAGRIHSTRLKDDAAAAHVWRRVLGLVTEHPKAFNELRKHYLGVEDWDGLEWLFRQHSTVQELVRTLESQAKSLEDTARAALLRKIAGLWMEQAETRRAVKALEQVIEIDPQDAEAARQLIPIYQELESWDRLPSVYDVVLEATADVADRQALLVAKAEVAEHRLGNADEAFFCYVSAFKEDFRNGAIRAQFDRLAEASGEWEVYVDVLEEFMDRLADDPDAQVRAYLDAARVHHQRLANHERALEHYGQVLAQLEPGNAEALDATETIYRETEDWDALVGILRMKLDSGRLDEESQRALHFEVGAVYRDRLQNPTAAMQTYQEMMELYPGETRVYDELAHLHLQSEDWTSLRDVVERKLQVLADSPFATPPELAALQCELGMLAYAHLSDIGRAVERYKEALHADPACDLAVRSLEELLPSEEHRAGIASALEAVYETRGDLPRLADTLEIQLQMLPADARPERERELARLVNLYQEIGDHERALSAASRLFRSDPNNSDLRSTLEALAAELGEWAHLADLYEDTVDDVSEVDSRVSMYEVAAQCARDHLQDVDRAEILYSLILTEQPHHPSALDALESVYGETDQPGKLLEVLRTKEGLATDEETRIGFRFQTSRLLADRLERIPDAIEDMLEILAAQPENLAALEWLDALYVRAQQWEDLHDVLHRRADLTDAPGEKAALLVRLAELKEVRLEAVDDAIDTYSRILELDVRRPEAVAALERLFANEEWSVRVAPLLEPSYRAADDWRGLVRVYAVLEQAAGSPEERVELDYRMARLHEHQGADPIRAFELYGEAYKAQPEREDTMGQLLRLAQSLDAWNELATLLREHVDDVADSDRRREVHRVIAQMLRDRVGDATGAIEHFQAILELSPHDIPAIDALIALHESRSEHAPLVEMLRTKAPLVDVPESRKALLLRAGSIADETLDATDDAIAVYEEVLQIDPDDGVALEALASLYERTTQWEDHCRILEMQERRSKDLDEQKLYARARAAVQETHLESPEAAIETFHRILGWDPTDLAALSDLDTLFEKTERWDELLQTIDREIELIEPAAQRAALLRKAHIYQDRLEDELSAVTMLRQILEMDVHDTSAADMLETMVRAGEYREEAFAVLDGVLAETGQWQRQFDLLMVLVEHREDPYARIEALHRMGKLAEDRLVVPETAFDCYGRALKTDLYHADSMAAVERLASSHSLWPRLVELLSGCATSSDDPLRRQQLLLRAAEILKDDVGDYERAIATYAVVLEDEAENLTALEALDELYLVTEQWANLAGILRREVDVATETGPKIDLYFRLADVLAEHLGDTRAPFDCYHDVFYLERGNAMAVERLEGLARAAIRRPEVAQLLEPYYIEEQSWERLHRLLELRLEDTEDKLDRFDLLRRLAELNLEHLGRPEDAVHWYAEAFRTDSNDDALLGRLEELVEETGLHTRLKEVLLAVAMYHEDSDRKVAFWHKAAHIVERQLLDQAEAETIYQFIVNEDPANLQAWQAFDRLYEEQQRWGELEIALMNEIDHVPYDDDRIGLLLRLGALQRDRLERTDDAIESYKQALELFDTNAPALQALADLYRATGAHQELFDILRRQSEVAESDDVRVRLLSEMAELAEGPLAKASDAVELWDEVLMLDRTNLGAVRRIQALHESQGMNDELAQSYERELEMLGEAETGRRIDLYRRLGHLWTAPLEDPHQAQMAWTRLLELSETDVEAMRALSAIYEEEFNHEALAGLLEQMVASLRFEGEELTQLYVRLAEIWSESLPEPEKAIEAWGQVRERAPQMRRAVDALDELFEMQQRFEDRAAVLADKVDLCAPEERVGILMILGEVEQYQLQRWEEAAAAYQRVLEVEPSNEEAGERLEYLYNENGRWESLIGLLSGRIEHIDDAEDRRELHMRLARLYREKQDDAASAFDCMRRAHGEVPGDPDVLGALQRAGMEIGSYRDVLEELELALAVTDDPEDRVDLGIRCARLLRDHVDDPAAAIAHFRGVLNLSDEHPAALQELGELLEQSREFEALVPILEKRFEIDPDPYERIQIGLRIGEVLRDELQDLDRAIAAFRRVLDAGESEGRSVAALETIFEQTERWRELISVLEVKAQMSPGDETRIRLRIGRILEEKETDFDGAIEVYEDIVRFDETQTDALDRLCVLYFEKQEFDQLVTVYERLLAAAATEAQQLEYCDALASIHVQIYGNKETAAEYYYRMLELDPGHTDALGKLETIYEELGDWEKLIDILARRLARSEEAGDTAEWAEVKERIAGIYAERLDDPDNAIFTYRELRERMPEHAASLEALEQLYRTTEQWEQVLDILETRVNASTDPADRVRRQIMRGGIAYEHLRDPGAAIDFLNRALSEDPTSDEALSLLERVYRDREEWENVIEVLLRRDRHVETDTDKSAIQKRIAAVYRERLNDPDRAVRHLVSALEFLPDDVEAASELAQLYVGKEEWAKAEPWLRFILDRTGRELPLSERVTAHYLRGMALEHMLRQKEALAEYEAANALDPSDLQVAQALGRLFFGAGELEKAERIYGRIIDRIETEGVGEDRVAIYKVLGEIALQRGDDDRAKEYLEKTIAMQPGDPEALRGMVDLCASKRFWKGFVQYAGDLRDLLTDPLEQFDLQLRIGDVHLNELGHVDDAVTAYQTALEYRPTSKAAHSKIVEVLVKAQRYVEAVGVLERLIGLEQDDRRKARYHGAIGDIYRNHLSDDAKAVEYFNRALDADPSQLKLFQAIDEILTLQRDWKELQRSYKRMLVRVEGDESQRALQYQLCFNLGEIYRSRLKKKDGAKNAFEAALALKPKDVKSLTILAELYEVDSELDKAIQMERAMLEQNPNELAHYRNLKRLFRDTGDTDAAWVACGVLAMLNKADEREQAFYEEYRSDGIVEDVPTLSDEDWLRFLYSKGQDPTIGLVLDLLFHGGLGALINRKAAKDLGLKKKHIIGPETKELFTHVLGSAARVLGIEPLPPLYESTTSRGLEVQDTFPPLLLVGAPLRKDRSLQELAFVIGKALTYFHRWHVAVWLAGGRTTANAIIQGAIKHFHPGWDVGPLAKDAGFASIVSAIAELSPQVKSSLERHVATLVRAGEPPNVTRWFNQLELTADHAGLLLCNDLVLAREMVKGETLHSLFMAPSRLSPSDKIRDLAVYALSEDYLALRKRLGVQVHIG